MTGSQNVSSSKQRPNTDRSSSPASLTWSASTDFETPMLSDAETDSDSETGTAVDAEREKTTLDFAATREVLAREIAEAVELPARESQEQILRVKKREEMERDNRVIDEIDGIFGPTWKGEESESEEKSF